LAAREQGFQLHVFRGAVNAQQSAFSPLIDQILRAGGGTQREATSIRRVLSAALTKLGPDFAEVAPYFDALHNAPDDAGQARSTVSKDIREKALDILSNLKDEKDGVTPQAIIRPYLIQGQST
jgi:hypothetical protein